MSGPQPSPSPEAAPTPTSIPDVSHIALPNVPSNLYQLLSDLADTIDTTNGHLNTAASNLQDINGKTNGAIQNVTSISSGQTTDTLVTIWSSTQTDFKKAHDPLSTITTNTHMGGSPNPLRSALDQSGTVLQNGLVAMENIHMLQVSCPLQPPSAQEVQGWIQQVNALTGALGTITIAMDAMAMAIRSLNGGFGAVCATGFTPGASLPTFSKHAFSSTSSSASGSGDGYTRLKQTLQSAGLSSKKITNILQALQSQGMSEADVTQFLQQLEKSGLSQEQIVKFFSKSQQVAKMPEIWKLYQNVSGVVPNVDRVLFDMGNGSATNFSGSLYQLQFIDDYVKSNPHGPFISDVEAMIGSQKGPDILLDNNTVIDLKSYDWSQLANRNYVQTTFGNGVTVEQGLENQLSRYMSNYPGQKIVYYSNSAYGRTLPASIQAIFDRLGIEVKFWP